MSVILEIMKTYLYKYPLFYYLFHVFNLYDKNINQHLNYGL